MYKVIKVLLKGGITFFALFLLFFWVYLQLSGLRGDGINYLFNLLVGVLYLAVGVISIYSTKGIESRPKRNFLLLYGNALIYWAIASFIWAYYNIILHTAVPYPSIADIFFIIFSIMMGGAFWYYFDIFHAQITKRSLSDSLLIIISVYFIIFFVLYQPKYELTTPILEVIANYLYPLLDATILSLAFISLRLEKKEEIIDSLLITLAILTQVAGDVMFSFKTSNKTYWNGDISDLLFLLTAVFSFIGILRIKKGFSNTLNKHIKTYEGTKI